MLTTTDNPYNPFDQFEQWLLYDNQFDHHCCEIVARITNESDELSDSENEEERENAIDRFIADDPINLYKKVKMEDFKGD